MGFVICLQESLPANVISFHKAIPVCPLNTLSFSKAHDDAALVRESRDLFLSVEWACTLHRRNWWCRSAGTLNGGPGGAAMHGQEGDLGPVTNFYSPRSANKNLLRSGLTFVLADLAVY